MHHLPEILALLVGGVLFLITAGLIYRVGWIPSGIPSHPTRHLLCLLAAGCLVSYLGLILLFLGHFTRPALLTIWSLILIALALFKHPPGDPSLDVPPGLRQGDLVQFIAALLLIAGLFTSLRPDENLLGNWDPGVYLAQGSAIAAGGTYDFPDTLSPLLTDAERDAFYPVKGGRQVKMPGFFVSQRRPHHLEPQFFPLYPLRVAFLQLFGNLQASLYASSLGAFLSLLFVYLIGTRLAGGWGGVFALFLLLVHPVQVWFASFHTAELHVQAMFLAGAWCWLVWREHRTAGTAFLAGTLFSLLLFTSVTGLVLAGLYALMHLFFVRGERSSWYFYVPIIPAGILSLVQIWFFTPQYFKSVMEYLPLLRGMTGVWIVFDILVIAAVGWFIQLTCKSKIKQQRIVHGAGVWGLCIAVLLIALAWGNQVILPVFLLKPVALILAAFGWWVLLERRPAEALALVLPAVVFTALFTFYPFMSANYPWTFKRMLPVTLPVACLLMGMVGTWILDRRSWGRWRYAIITVCLVAATLPLYQQRTRAFHRDWMGFRIFSRAVAEDLPDEAVVIARKWLATPLELVYGKRVLPLYDAPRGKAGYKKYEPFLQRMLAEGRPVYIVHETNRPAPGNWSPVLVTIHRLDASVLEQSRVPGRNRIKDRRLLVRIDRIMSLETP